MKKVMWLRNTTRLAALLSGAVMVGGGSAAAASPISIPPMTAPAPGPHGNIHFNVSNAPFQLANPRTITIQGKLVNGYCMLQAQLNKPKGAGPVGMIEEAINPTTCTEIVAVGPIARFLRPMYPTGRSNLVSLPTQTNTQASSSSDPSASASFTTEWDDFLGVPLTSVTDSMNWSYNGNSVLSYNGHGSWWEQIDGWSPPSFSTWQGSSGQSAAYVSSNATFYNGVFCPAFGGTAGTWIHYQPNTLHVTGRGTAGGSVNTWPTGQCDTWQIHYYSYLN